MNKVSYTMKKQGILTIISGFSGVGKGTIVNRLMEKYPAEYCLSISATTRAPRVGDVDGVNYFFLTREQFESMIESDELLEYAQYVNNYYGTPKKFVVDKLNEGINVILEIEMQGALKIKEQYPDTLLIFVAPEEASVLEARLRGRGTETEEQIINRLKRAAEEAVYMKDYEYIVINDELERAVDEIHQIITNEHDKVIRRKDFINNLSKDLSTFVKGE